MTNVATNTVVERVSPVLGSTATVNNSQRDYSNEIDWDKLTGQLMARNESVKLANAYLTCFNENSTKRQLTLITGPSGVGKTSLALALRNRIANDNGFMLKGKFDLLENNLQTVTTHVFSAFTEAFTQYVDLVMGAGESTVQSLKKALERRMDFNELQVLQEMVPALSNLVDRQLSKQHTSTSTLSTLKGADVEDRLIQIITSFFRIISSQTQPIILFLDDLQWANRSALNLLTSLLSLSKEGVSVSPFMLLCTCRMNEVSEDHQLALTLRDIKDNGTEIEEIQVSNMTMAEVNHIVSDALHLSKTECLPLSEALFRETDGNLLFLIELMKKLRDEEVIQFERSRWVWDMEHVNAAVGIGSIRRLIEEKFYRLDSKLQELLRIASCLGSTFSIISLSYTGVGDSNEIITAFQTVERLGFIDMDAKYLRCRFLHDRVQQTIYQLTPADVRDQLHLNIGRQLKQSMPRHLAAEKVLLISHQISLGVHLIYDPNDKQEMAELFFQAGQKAALSSSFVTASAYLHLAISLLSRRHWREQYKLSLQMYNFAAELDYYNGNLQRVDELVDAVIKHARSFEDSLVSRFTRIYSLGTRDCMVEGLSESLDVLKQLGEKLPRNPGVVHIIVGLIRCNCLLRGKSDEYILQLPTMRDKKKQTAMRLLLYSIVFAFYVSGEHVPLIAFRLVENTIRYGMSGMACMGFACLGMVSVIQGNIDEGCRYGTLALKIFDQHDSQEWQARVVFVVHGMVFPFKIPFRDAVSPMHAAHRSSLVLGDIHERATLWPPLWYKERLAGSYS